ncbi:hypothetical protein [Stratiformator vulcanicus]|uniref:Uncharacterized protein n=1 Tax=Stratiformator vulcanicus TaxID=2527980 RepID=A0A517R261_9PLAN|nr:hypothetical protein [Stratiformator vulcanicus]QDT37969.1 hypothetical protein Pan189_23530 [Stratiformator vulcanicus]
MNIDNHTLAKRFFWTFALVTFFGTITVGFFGVGIVWMLIATPILARWWTQSQSERRVETADTPPVQMVQLFFAQVGVGFCCLIAGGIAGAVGCGAGFAVAELFWGQHGSYPTYPEVTLAVLLSAVMTLVVGGTVVWQLTCRMTEKCFGAGVFSGKVAEPEDATGRTDDT